MIMIPIYSVCNDGLIFHASAQRRSIHTAACTITNAGYPPLPGTMPNLRSDLSMELYVWNWYHTSSTDKSYHPVLELYFKTHVWVKG